MIKVRCAGGCGDVCYDETAIEVAWPEPWRCDPCEARHEAVGDALRAERDALAATVAELRSALEATRSAFGDFEDALNRAQRWQHNYQLWGDEEHGWIDAARNAFFAVGERALATDPGRAVALVEAMRRVVEAARALVPSSTGGMGSGIATLMRSERFAELRDVVRDLDALEGT